MVWFGLLRSICLHLSMGEPNNNESAMMHVGSEIVDGNGVIHENNMVHDNEMIQVGAAWFDG
ncbi:hypothetical protein EJB05_04716, partial [Eragrostis curvula]